MDPSAEGPREDILHLMRQYNDRVVTAHREHVASGATGPAPGHDPDSPPMHTHDDNLRHDECPACAWHWSERRRAHP